MRTLSSFLILAACASPTSQGQRGSRGLTADQHVAAADDHATRAEQLATWPERRHDPFNPQLDPDAGTWYRTWDTVRTELRLARYHRSAAAQLVAEYEEACGQRDYAEVSVSPLERFAIGGGPTEQGAVVLLSPDAGAPDALMAAMRCHRAWMMLGRTDMDSCLLDLAGIRVDAHGDAGGITVEITTADPKLVPELQRRTAHDLEAASHRRPVEGH